MSRKPELTQREWLLLSAYLDGELSAREERQVEELLQAKPASRETLEGLRRTRQVLKHVPERQVPHSFTITEAMLRKPLLPSFSRMFSYSSALAGILLLVVFGFDLYSGMHRTGTADQAAQPAVEAFVAAEAPKMAAQETPQIIFWGNSAPLLGAYGKGGGGGGGNDLGYGVGGGAATDTLPESAPLLEGAPASNAEESVPMDETAPAAEVMPAMPEVAQEETVPQLYDQETLTESENAESARPTGSEPILGIRPAAEQGSVQPVTRIKSAAPSEIQPQIPFKMLEGILALMALLSALVALIFRKHS